MFGSSWIGKRSSKEDRGVALIMVVAISAVLLVIVAGAATYTVSGLRKASTDQNWSAAESAAYAGIEEYQSRLSNDTAYFQYGNPLASFGSGSARTLPTGTQVNPAFGIGVAGSWATIAGSGGAAKFRYEVDNSQYINSGVIRLRSTGLSGTVTRSIVADLKQQGFIDFLYFTDYEIQDPAQSGFTSAACRKYAWAGRTGSSCGELAFGTEDVMDGPVHTNDTLRACGADFLGRVTTAYNTTVPRYVAKNSSGTTCASANFALSGDPVYSPVIGMPSTNSQMKKETRSDLGADVPRPGCLYTGPTSIVYNSGGTMTVRSPWTKKTNIAGGDPETSGTTPAACGVIGTAPGQLGSVGGATIDVPIKNLIYVQNVPTVSGNPNYWAPGIFPGEVDCKATPTSGGTTVTCVGASSSTVTAGGNGNGIGYPRLKEVSPTNTSYGFRNGDVFVNGVIKGQATVAAENYIYITGNLTYNDPNADMLGLVGNNAVWIWNPVNSSDATLLTDTSRTVQAAILSVSHTFMVQNFTEGSDRGTLKVTGGIAQKYRGSVRQTKNGIVHGYAKDYAFDPRFKYTAPPKFLSPVTTTYGVSTWMDTTPAMNADGAYR